MESFRILLRIRILQKVRIRKIPPLNETHDPLNGSEQAHYHNYWNMYPAPLLSADARNRFQPELLGAAVGQAQYEVGHVVNPSILVVFGLGL